jgi:hypothetical protein
MCSILDKNENNNECQQRDITCHTNSLKKWYAKKIIFFGGMNTNLLQ